jgi:RNA-directed DNA polymerase
MREERRGQQSSTSVKGILPANSHSGHGGDQWKDGTSYLNRWQRISLRAQKKTSVFNNLLLHVNEESLTEAFQALDGSKALGVDKVSKSKYEQDLEKNISDLAKRVRQGGYKPQAKREVLIPKAGGKTRPLAIACFEDKMVDWVVAKILTQVFEPTFIRNSFGFRPNKSAHQAIEACYNSLAKNKRPFVVEIDFSNFFNTIPHKQLMSIIGKRVGDVKFKGLIRRFLKGPTIKQDGSLEKSVVGTPQGGLMSPILANIYLNEVVDQWFLKNFAGPDKVIVRYADDAVFFFRKEEDATSFLSEFKERVENFGLTVNDEKSKSINFKKSSKEDFNFLGFTFYWGPQGKRRILKVKTEKTKLIKAIREFYDWIKQSRNKMKHSALWEMAKVKIQGHYNYFGFWMNRRKLLHFYRSAVKSLFKWLNRRSQMRSYGWPGFLERLKQMPLGRPSSPTELKNLGRSFGHVQT